MADAVEILKSLQKLNVRKVAFESFKKHSDEVVPLNQEQLFEGKTAKGEFLFPTYFADPFFKTRAAARRYSDWKDVITPHPKRRRGVPNLFINGFFYKSIELKLFPEGFQIDSRAFMAANIKRKYGQDVFGLNEDSREKLIGGGLAETWKKNVEKQTGLKFTVR